jgi:Rrf2 family protein
VYGGPATAVTIIQAVRTTAKADYAVRAAVELAAAGDGPVSTERIAEAQGIPANFLENILVDLRRAGVVESRRGAAGGYLLARPATEISIADVIRAVEGPLANVRGISPDALEYEGSAARLRDVWVALRASVRSVLEQVTLADVARAELPEHVVELTRGRDAWVRR